MIKGFSRLSKEEKIKLLEVELKDINLKGILQSVDLENDNIGKIIHELSENVLAVFPMPYSIAPNFKIDGKTYFVPMVTEESSVVAAASKSAGYWFDRGGFHTKITGMTKTGQVHFKYSGSNEDLKIYFNAVQSRLFDAVRTIDEHMRKRGGGIQNIRLVDHTDEMAGYYQLHVEFNTCDAMGANYMNSCLESIAAEFLNRSKAPDANLKGELQIIMSILSNYSPESAVKVWVECPVEELDDGTFEITAGEFVQRFTDAVKIAEIDMHRAVTHNKGIYNGVDAVALATGNDWRAIESNGHAFASASGRYKSLSTIDTRNGAFKFEATIPLQVGTVGGIINLHPLTNLSLEILQNPTAKEVMSVMASAGLASNFAAIRSLITTGIQKGHMKMHLNNMLRMFQATEQEIVKAKAYFQNREISHIAVEMFITDIRND